MPDILDWTNSDLEKLDMATYEARADELAARLREETGGGRLPFLTMPYAAQLKKELDTLKDFLKGFDHMLLLGIGGSALGARALQQAFYPQQDQPGHTGPSLWIADNVDAYALEAYLAKLPPEKTVVVTVSKSGGTIETVGQYFILKKWMQHHLGDAWSKHMLLVTDEKQGFLRGEADSFGIKSLPVPDNLGGRYSVLSAVGLIPAVFLGMDTDALIAGAQEVAAPLTDPNLTGDGLASHSAFRLAAWGAALQDKGFAEMIFFAYIPLWASFGDWFAQLWAESLGKEGKGSQPVPAIGVTDQHSVNQMFMDGVRNKACLYLTCPNLPAGPKFPTDLPDQFSYVRGKDFGELIQAEGLGNRMALSMNGVPLVELKMGSDGPKQAGKLIALLGAATILTGWLMGINPLDQPAVELGKRLAKARMNADGLTEEKADLNAFLTADRDLREF
ncbi:MULTISPECIES: glucose-6-phosphate isomerase [unclassified Pseudodesulfovibrio]|uniref:glucose-6-phosphate isomerase n=1 Tax=unclassified Pseudodesulfovibrio TaxID=2661612 RepID=UPI000FEBF7E6|nr:MULTISPECIES: glucose-6-phosphate isomerase [unclassified Pseudodesulfovibrio]MCJ2165666.1 glucose-6-phosphate isomerase [Pseudodesulfovibrio sp. S3-i]RWU02976.1 glucose-6-phosphate isomerase [Pseudodesulfovibrio sp. S3]